MLRRTVFGLARSATGYVTPLTAFRPLSTTASTMFSSTTTTTTDSPSMTPMEDAIREKVRPCLACTNSPSCPRGLVPDLVPAFLLLSPPPPYLYSPISDHPILHLHSTANSLPPTI